MVAKTRTEIMENALLPDWQPLGQLEYVPTDCPVCKTNTKGELRYRKAIRDTVMRYYVCPKCGVLYANPRASVKSLENIYASKDFFEGGIPGGDHLNYFAFISGERYLRMTARDRISRIKQHCQQGRMLEAGSAAGFFLVEAKAAGYDVLGVEFSAPMAESASRRWGVPVIPASIELLELPVEGYDVIASWGLMTIVQDPLGLIQKFHRALKPGGIWAFNTYYYDGLWPRVVGNRWDILTVNFSQLYTRQLVLDIVAREGFELLSRRREMPYTDLMKIADKLAQTLGMTWLPGLAHRLGIGDLIIRIPLPDVLEYLWRKT
jgi:SAM-dependent methyltransferase